MCDCNGDKPCDFHTRRIMAGLAKARDLNDRGSTEQAEQVMQRLTERAGAGRVRSVMDRVRDGELDLSVHGSSYPGVYR